MGIIKEILLGFGYVAKVSVSALTSWFWCMIGLHLFMIYYNGHIDLSVKVFQIFSLFGLFIFEAFNKRYILRR